MIQVSVDVNDAQVAEAVSLFEFLGGNTRDAIRIAINKTIPKIRNRQRASGVSMSTAVRDQVRLSAKYVSGLLQSEKATKFKLSGIIKTPSRGLLLTRYSTVPKIANTDDWIGPAPQAPARGIRVKVKPGGPTKVLSKDHFYMVLPNSKRLAIARRRDAPGPKGGRIDVLYGPSVSQVLSVDTLKDVVEPAAVKEYEFQLLDAMRYLLQKQYPPY